MLIFFREPRRGDGSVGDRGRTSRKGLKIRGNSREVLLTKAIPGPAGFFGDDLVHGFLTIKADQGTVEHVVALTHADEIEFVAFHLIECVHAERTLIEAGNITMVFLVKFFEALLRLFGGFLHHGRHAGHANRTLKNYLVPFEAFRNAESLGEVPKRLAAAGAGHERALLVEGVEDVGDNDPVRRFLRGTGLRFPGEFWFVF